MTAILVKVFFGIVIFFVAIYYSTKYLANKAHPYPHEADPTITTPQHPNQQTAQANDELRTKVEQELFNVEQREVVKKESKSEFPIDKPKKKKKYYPKKQK